MSTIRFHPLIVGAVCRASLLGFTASASSRFHPLIVGAVCRASPRVLADPDPQVVSIP